MREPLGEVEAEPEGEVAGTVYRRLQIIPMVGLAVLLVVFGLMMYVAPGL